MCGILQFHRDFTDYRILINRVKSLIVLENQKPYNVKFCFRHSKIVQYIVKPGRTQARTLQKGKKDFKHGKH